jgi:hypothetical protein
MVSHDKKHELETHIWPLPHVVAQAPQLLASVCVSTHSPPQFVVPLAQTH